MKYHGTMNMAHPENYDDLWKWFSIYNDLFFGGLLKGFVRIEIYLEEFTRERTFSLCDGYTEVKYPGRELDPRFRKEQVEVLIGICNRDNSLSNAKNPSSRMNPFKRAKLYQETLLHEILHALFYIYECNCSSSPNNFNGSHGPCWQAAAERVENNGCLGWHPNLERMHSLVCDLYGRSNLPNDAVLRSLRLDICEILSELGERREYQQASEKTFERGSEGWENMLPFKTNQCIRGELTVDAYENAEYERLRLRGKDY